MENLIFSLNATVPVFLMMILGFAFKKIEWIDDIFFYRYHDQYYDFFSDFLSAQ